MAFALLSHESVEAIHCATLRILNETGVSIKHPGARDLLRARTIDSGAVDAKYRDGVLHISVKRREAAQPRRITIQ